MLNGLGGFFVFERSFVLDFYVYLHKKKTNGEVFYVGKGCGPRAWTKARRSSEWNEVVEKYGYFVEIVENNLQEWYSFELEGLLIDYYGKLSDKDGSLVNKKGGSSCNFDSTIKKADRDYSTYTFYNFSTEEKFIGNRYDFKKKYKDVEAHILFYGNRSSKGWIVLDSKSDFEVLCLKINLKESTLPFQAIKNFIYTIFIQIVNLLVLVMLFRKSSDLNLTTFLDLEKLYNIKRVGVFILKEIVLNA